MPCPFAKFVHGRYGEEVGELDRTYNELTAERNQMLVRLEGLKRRKQLETEVTTRVAKTLNRLSWGSIRVSVTKPGVLEL